MKEADDFTYCRFRWLLILISDMLEVKDVQKATFFLRDQLGPDSDTINGDALKLLEVLDRGNYIHEGNTGLLRTCLPAIGRVDILENLDWYEKERQAVTKKLKIQCSSVDGPFFGHRDIMDRIVGILDTSYDHVHMVCIAGMPGTGKTRLAKEACFRLRQFNEVIFVDLRELKSIEAIFFAIMHGFGVESRIYEPENMYSKLRSHEPVKHGSTVLFLDSVDDPLEPGSGAYPNPTYNAFISMLENITNLPNDRLKLLITSRFGVERIPVKKGSMDCWRLDEENELDMESAVQMVRYHAGKTRLEDNEAEQFVRICSKIPLALKVVASRLQDQTVKPEYLLRYLSPASGDREQGVHITKALSHCALPQSDLIGPCLKKCIQNLPHISQRNLIKLAVIPGTFTLIAARVILGYKQNQQAQLQLELQELKYRSLLDSEQQTESRWSHWRENRSMRYSLHLLLRSFVQQFAEESKGELAKHFEEAEKRFVDYYVKRMKKIAKMLQCRAVVALACLQKDSANYIKALNIVKTSKEFHAPDTIYWLRLVVEMLFFTKDRVKFYRERAESAKGYGEMLVFAESRCLELYQLMELGHKADVLLPKIQEAEAVLKKLDKEKICVQLSLSTCYQFRGDLFLRDKNWTDAVPLLEACLAIREKHLKDHVLTAQAYNSLGGAYQDKAFLGSGKIPAFLRSGMERGRDCYKKALDICHKMTGPFGQHLNAPTYLMNLGTCLHDMDDYEGAVVHYKQALEQEKKLGMDGTEKTCTSLKNIAMSYYEMERYDDAIPIAKKAMEGRKRLLELHPLTARSIYFVGSLNLTNKNYKEARKYLEEALKMEEELWRKGMEHSIDWPKLKEKLEDLLKTEGKQTTLSAYKRRFRRAEKKCNQEKPNLEAPDDSSETDSLNSSSSDSKLLKRKRGCYSSTDSSEQEEAHVHSLKDSDDGLPQQRTERKKKKLRKGDDDCDAEDSDSTITNVSGTSIQMGEDDLIVHIPRPTPADDESDSLKSKWGRCVIF